MKPLIGITAGTVHNLEHPHESYVYGQKYPYATSISEAGGIPVIIPITRNDTETKEIFERLDGILFAGGNDISPDLYHAEERACQELDVARDRHEAELMRLALEAHKPVLGVCRGMQLLNVVRGGTLHQDIGADIPGALHHRGDSEDVNAGYVMHSLTIEADSRLASILGTSRIEANSHHHQAVKAVGGGLSVSARSDDGVVEAIEDKSEQYVIGVQPHPERLVEHGTAEWQPLFASFVAATKKSRL